MIDGSLGQLVRNFPQLGLGPRLEHHFVHVVEVAEVLLCVLVTKLIQSSPVANMKSKGRLMGLLLLEVVMVMMTVAYSRDGWRQWQHDKPGPAPRPLANLPSTANLLSPKCIVLSSSEDFILVLLIIQS